MRPTFSNEQGGTFVLIEPGQNGEISIGQPFFIGARPVTQVEWVSVMGNNPSKFQEGWAAGLRPVESVSWLDCQSFISKLNDAEIGLRLGLSGLWRLPTAEEWDSLLFGWKVVRHVKSNAIVYAAGERTLGVGAGQMSRVDSSKIAVWKAGEADLSLEGSVIASDAFFPFADGLVAAAEAGADAAIQPGGSVRDDEVIAAANERDMAMVFTGMRHFRH